MSRARKVFPGPSRLEEAKTKLRIHELWELRRWPGTPSKSCTCPYRPDKAASGSVLKDGLLFHDFASGETFDAPGLLGRVENMDPSPACRLFIELAGTKREQAASPAASRPSRLEPPGEGPLTRPSFHRPPR